MLGFKIFRSWCIYFWYLDKIHPNIEIRDQKLILSKYKLLHYSTTQTSCSKYPYSLTGPILQLLPRPQMGKKIRNSAVVFPKTKAL